MSNLTDKIIDSTKLSCYQDCERKYFYRHILHWAPESPNIHLEFGVAWHLAKEHLLLSDYSAEALEKAYSLFLEHYRQHFAPDTDRQYSPKDPEHALAALTSYAEARRKSKSYKVHLTEVAGQVGVTHDYSLVFKIDAVIEDRVGLWVLDHKTASRLASAWVDSWQLNLQMGTYVHALRSYNPKDTVIGAIVEATIFRQKDHEHISIPVRKSEDAMNSWYWTVSQRLALLDWNYEALAEAKDSDAVLTAFPQNFGSCTNYNQRCPYFDFCCAWANPLQHCEKPPIGYTSQEWNPLDVVRTARTTWGVEK